MSLAALLATSPLLLAAVTTVLGLLVGSFLNVVIYRLPIMMERDWTRQCSDMLNLEDASLPHSEHAVFNLAKPDSHCPACGHSISAMENIPLLSYALQRGKCRGCQALISPRYPVIEAVTASLSVLVVLHFGVVWLTAALLLFTWSLIVLTMIDADHQLLPDDITLPLLWGGLIVNCADLLVPLQDAVLGAVFGYLSLWSIYWLFKLLTGKEGMGHGDFKLLAALGAWMGWQALPTVILMSSVVGAVTGLTLITLQGRDRSVPIPFGPYLAAAGYITLIWGEPLADFYLQQVLG